MASYFGGKVIKWPLSSSLLMLCASAPLWSVAAVKLVRAMLILVGRPGDDDELTVAAWHDFIANDWLLCPVLIASVTCAVVGYCIRRSNPIVALLLFFPDQFWLTLGGVDALVHILFSPQNHHSKAFLLSAITPQIAMMFSHAAAIIFVLNPTVGLARE